MRYGRWKQVKRVVKLNNNLTSPKHGEEGYDPAHKFDMLDDVLVSNINSITEKADLDTCADETTWAFEGYGEAKSGLVVGIHEKPGVTKGGQTVVLSDISRCRPHAYLHRHKLHTHYTGFVEGPNEVQMIMEQIKPLVKGETGDGRRQIYDSFPHSTWDNYFSGDPIMNWIGEEGFGATMMC